MSDALGHGNPFSQLIAEGDEILDLSTDLTVDEMLAGESSSHFPEKRNRRREDQDTEVVSRLRSALEAIDRGETYDGEDNADHHLMQDCYLQF